MPNEFNKEEKVAFDAILEGFQDALVLSRNVATFKTDQTMMARSGDIIWRPMPYVMTSYNGTDQTANFRDKTQLSVPATIGYEKSVPWTMSALDLRDAIQEGRLGDGAKQKLASDINVAVLDVAALQGTLVVPRPLAAAGFVDVAQIEAIMNETGVADDARYLALSTRDYNGMAADLANRAYLDKKALTGYERAYVGTIASFETYKLDYSRRLLLAGGGGAITISTLAAGGNVYVPRATVTAATGQRGNVDNRYQTVTVSATANVRAGDAFTIATVNNVHQITKQPTGQLKTFRVISVDSATTMTISPPLITAQGGTEPELQYQNCSVLTPAANSAIVWLNIATAAANPFWHKSAIELLPGKYEVPSNAGAAVMRASTDQGLELVMTKQYDISTMTTKFRLDTRFGVVLAAPEMAGIILFAQV
jgi:hypothetical protein